MTAGEFTERLRQS